MYRNATKNLDFGQSQQLYLGNYQINKGWIWLEPDSNKKSSVHIELAWSCLRMESRQETQRPTLQHLMMLDIHIFLWLFAQCLRLQIQSGLIIYFPCVLIAGHLNPQPQAKQTLDKFLNILPDYTVCKIFCRAPISNLIRKPEFKWQCDKRSPYINCMHACMQCWSWLVDDRKCVTWQCICLAFKCLLEGQFPSCLWQPTVQQFRILVSCWLPNWGLAR